MTKLQLPQSITPHTGAKEVLAQTSLHSDHQYKIGTIQCLIAVRKLQ